MMQVAQILWILTCRGCLQRLYDWARRATEQGLARAVWEGLRACRLPPDLPPLGQIRFGFSLADRAESSQPDPVDHLNFDVRHTLHGAASLPANRPSPPTSPLRFATRHGESG